MEPDSVIVSALEHSKINMESNGLGVRMLAVLPATLLLTIAARAQIGSGWSVYTPSEKFQYESNDIGFSISPPPSYFNNGYCQFNRTNPVDEFQLLTHNSNRAEIRVNDDYSTGSHQFQADVLIATTTTTGETIHQIFNGPAGPWLLIKETSNYFGSIHVGAATASLATNLYGRWFQFNSINDMSDDQTYLYVNGQLVWQGTNPGGTFYTKYGAYGTHDDAHPADMVFSNVVLFTGGTPTGNADFSLSASPTSQSVTQGNSVYYTNTVSAANGFNGTVDLSVSGLPANATASFSPPSVSGSGTSTLTVATSTSTSTGTYTLTITGTSLTNSTTATVNLIVNQPTSLPAGWTDADIGSPANAGYATYANGTFTVSGSGSDIWNSSDQFNYAYESVLGDQTVIARVVSENGTDGYAKAGVMIRESSAADAVEASVLLTPTNGVAMEIRPATGASSINMTGWIRNVLPPQWVSVVRSGDTFSGYYSADGSSWTLIASTNLSMASSELAGLAVTSHYVLSANTATFDNVSINAPQPQPPAAPSGLISVSGDSQVALNWTASSGASSYNVKRSTVSGGPYTTIASGVTSTAYTDTSVVNGTTYYYVVSAVNSAGESPNSSEVSATPQAAQVPAAPTGLTAKGAKRKIGLSWNASSGATSYNVKRSNVSGGPYTTITAGVTTTGYTDSGIKSGTTYYYVVSALNAVGESPNSSEASATAK
ncbi:MAG: fibronectin type III domain-containing protein [Verrucomicrobiota bacterium]|nr:fibronectin type III domain-containing protein [Verrucomicrobiota bacterium]